MRTAHLSWALVAAVMACEPRARPAVVDLDSTIAQPDHRELHPIQLRATVLPGDAKIGFPVQVLVLNDSLLIVLDAHEPYLDVVRRTDGAVIASLGRRGEGPGEFAGLRSVSLSLASDVQFWAWDNILRRLTLIDLRRGRDERDSVMQFTKVIWPNNVVQTNDTTLAASSTSGAGGLLMMSLYTGAVETRGPPIHFAGPPIDSIDPAISRRELFGDQRLCFNRTTGQFVRMHRGSSRIEILDTAGTAVQIIEGPYRVTPMFFARPGARLWLYEPGSGPYPGDLIEPSGGPTSRGNREGYLGCVATPDRLFALFSGRLPMKFHGESRQGQFIHVFDWSGALQDVYELDRNIKDMALDPVSGTMYTVGASPEPFIATFRIPLNSTKD